jgi:hypothetical protein
MNAVVRSILALTLGSGTLSAAADTLRCGTHLVDIGESELDLLQECGEPAAKSGNRWFYDRGETRLRVIVEVVNGKITNITSDREENL